jgi:hypothetical protein
MGIDMENCQRHIEPLAHSMALSHKVFCRCLQTMMHMHRMNLPWPSLRARSQQCC